MVDAVIGCAYVVRPSGRGLLSSGAVERASCGLVLAAARGHTAAVYERISVRAKAYVTGPRSLWLVAGRPNSDGPRWEASAIFAVGSSVNGRLPSASSDERTCLPCALTDRNVSDAHSLG